MKKKRVLVVDDVLVNRILVEKRLLAGGDYCVDFASNGEEAVRLLKSTIFDLVITDINMPVMSGITLAEKIKRDNKNIKVLALTVIGPDEFDLSIFDGYLRTPCPKDDFLFFIKNHIKTPELV